MTVEGVFELDASKIRDISADALGPDGRLKVLPAEFWAGTTMWERALFGHRYGLYSFPTVELVDYLRELIGDRRAIEIGAGHGVLAQALGIPATDSHQQAKMPWKAQIAAAGQPGVPYGPNVQDMDAREAISRYHPQVVIGCWVTHKFNPKRPFAKGNEAGINELDLLGRVQTYIVVGNQYVHRNKEIWVVPHVIEHPDFVYSRARNGEPDFIARWDQQ